jgi:CheY-like chemotaxis protein
LPPRKFVDQLIQVIETNLDHKEITMGSTILYIEDNPDNMLLVQCALESRGYKLLKEMNGVDDITMAEGNIVDLMLLDINLPNLDGYELAKCLRKSGKPELAKLLCWLLTHPPGFCRLLTGISSNREPFPSTEMHLKDLFWGNATSTSRQLQLDLTI